MGLFAWAADNPYLTAALALLLFAFLGGIGFAAVRLAPRAALPPVLLAAAVHFGCYFVPRAFPMGFAPHNMSLPLDAYLPLWTPMIAVYLLAYVQWTVHWVLLSRQSAALCGRFAAGEILGKLLCAAVFVLYPTTLIRPSLMGGSVFDRVTALIYLLDAPTNLLPSVHCFQSWMCLRLALRAKGLPKWYAPFTAVFSTLVFASTLLVKQHVLLDLPAAILAAETGLLLARATRFDRALERLEQAIAQKLPQ